MKALLLGIVCSAGFLLGFAARAEAMPPFAQAYGVDCSVCHTQVPALNAYGRFVQRTGYASLDPHVLKRSIPVWVGENTSYDTQDPDKPHYTEFGNVAIHAAGVVGQSTNWSYHIHQWIVQNDQPGGVDTAWIGYNNLLHRDGHLMAGKIEAPGPSAFSQWFDLSGFASAAYGVGEHAWENDGNRWGAKLNYVHKALEVQAGYLASDQDLGGISEFSNATDKTFQWKLAYADPEQPLEAGVYGTRGSWPLEEGGFDQYYSITPYVQRDPVGYVPGFLAMYQVGQDGNPNADGFSAGSTAATLELYEPFLKYGLLSLREEWVNDGLGTQTRSGNIDLSYQLARYLRVYVEEGLQQNNIPAWRYMIWWTTPLSRPLEQ